MADELYPLCPIADLPPGGELAFAPATANAPPLFAIHGPEGPVTYINACPHLGLPLDWKPGKFLTADGTHILCATHAAEFRITDGLCLRGPCRGDTLTKVPCTVVNGTLMVPAEYAR
jgi:nitrite reductase/ring-hydroxylating ferredoxin subunit